MKLPLEIRSLIYKFHFLQDGIEGSDFSAGDECFVEEYDWFRSVSYRECPTGVSRTMPIYFQVKDFTFFSPSKANGSLHIVGPYYRQHVVRMILYMGNVSNYSVEFRKINHFTSLTHLSLIITPWLDNSQETIMFGCGLECKPAHDPKPQIAEG